MGKFILLSLKLVEFLVILLSCFGFFEISGRKLDDRIEFRWKPDKWKGCLKVKTCDEPGIRKRSLICVNSNDGEKVASRNCDRNNRPKRKEYCVANECVNQTNFAITYQDWQKCKPEPLSIYQIPELIDKNITIEGKSRNISTEEWLRGYKEIRGNWKRTVLESCGSLGNALTYVRRRNAFCTARWPGKNTRVETSVENCVVTSTIKPIFIQLCSVGCKRRCSVGLWASWENSQFLPKDFRFRRRQITYFPYSKENTNICPPLIDFRDLKERPNKVDAPVQLEFYAWGPCKKHDLGRNGVTPVIGMQTRYIKCVKQEGSRNDCDSASVKIIATSQLCILPRDCAVSQWSLWSNCHVVYSRGERNGKSKTGNTKTIYQQKRTRVVIITQLSSGDSCPHLQETRACDPILPPFYEQGNSTAKNSSYFWFAGSYTKCKSDGKDCRGGIKQRHVFCVRRGDANLNPVGSQFCAHMDKPSEKAFCTSQCKKVCALGEWTTWSGCTAVCAAGKSGIVRGTHYRVRRVLQHSGDANSCQDYAESRPCTLRNCVSWVVGTQTICLMDNIHRACGNGKTHRAVYCMNARGQQVDDKFCVDKMPPRSLPCHVPCSDDCVVGIWSSWGACEGKCDLNGTQAASYRTRKRRILANRGWSGRPCPDKSELLEKESCLGESCGTYHWDVSEWGTCQTWRYAAQEDDNRPKCVTGIVYRLVKCVNEAGLEVRDHLCSSFLKPRRSKECRICPVDCVPSPWSEWSDCPTECTYSKFQFYRKRHRFIIRPSLDGGKECPKNLTQTAKCDSCNDYEWRFSDWSNCTVTLNGDCRGLKTRRVYCVRRRDSTSQPDGNCLAKRGKPKEHAMCTSRRCDKSCVLSQWSEWGKCSKDCASGFTRRTRNVLGNRAECERGSEMMEERPCNTQPCGQYSLRIGKWSRCYPLDMKTKCGVGRQWRNVTCSKANGAETALQYCIEELYGGQLTLQFEQRCTVRCPLDCKLSPWTAYTPCSRKCGSGVKTRFRTIVQKATHGGQVCAAEEEQITETIPCMETQCFNFVWKSEPWSMCKITNQTRGRITKCGTGVQTRRVYCTDIRYSGRQSMINDSFCDGKERLATSDSCTLYCPGDCVVGEWTSWSRCSSVCPKPGHRRRERTVLRYPAHDGKSCPALESHQACNSKQCFTHHWRPTPWSSCLFYQDDTSCGIGSQRRMIDCVRSDGKIVHPYHCRVERRRIPMLLRMCTVPCPKNCEISEWGAWSSCQNRCNTVSMQRRIRFILARAANGGQSCLQSEPLQEFRSCPMMPCYKVEVGRWERCRPHFDKACGYGNQKRSINCVRDDGKIVDELHCPEINSDNYPKETSCRTPCQGDCIVTDWSLWSSCFASCTVKNQSMFDFGTRIRTRHVLKEADAFGRKCPLNLVETGICYDPKCFTFSWKTASYAGDTREVWCERSDGARVSNGCEMGLKPSKTITCQPKCVVSHAYCNSDIVCVCKKDFIPIFSSHGHLIHCLSDSNSFKNDTNEVTTSTSSKNKKDPSWFADLPIIIWVVIGVCFVYLLLFLAIVIVYTRRRKDTARERRAETVDVGTLTNPERIPLNERPKGHERSESKTSFATSSGRGSTLSTIGDHNDGEHWPEPPDNVVVSEFIRQHLKNFNKGSFCSTFSDESLDRPDRVFTSTRGPSFDTSGTL